METEDDKREENFEDLEVDQGIAAEFWEFLCENKKFWLIPIIIVLLLFGLLVFLGGTGAAPFIYTLF